MGGGGGGGGGFFNRPNSFSDHSSDMVGQSLESICGSWQCSDCVGSRDLCISWSWSWRGNSQLPRWVFWGSVCFQLCSAPPSWLQFSLHLGVSHQFSFVFVFETALISRILHLTLYGIWFQSSTTLLEKKWRLTSNLLVLGLRFRGSSALLVARPVSTASWNHVLHIIHPVDPPHYLKGLYHVSLVPSFPQQLLLIGVSLQSWHHGNFKWKRWKGHHGR